MINSLRVIILTDWTINVSRIDSIDVNYINKNDTKDKLFNSCKKILRGSIIYLDLIRTRPIRVAISREVKLPDIYTIDIKGENNLVNNDGGVRIPITGNSSQL